MNDQRWQDSVERRLQALEEELHGKNGLAQTMAGIRARMTLTTSVLLLILGALVANLFR